MEGGEGRSHDELSKVCSVLGFHGSSIIDRTCLEWSATNKTTDADVLTALYRDICTDYGD